MNKLSIVILAILFITPTTNAQIHDRTLSIQETAEISYSPDLCIMTVLVETHNEDKETAYSENKEIMSRIIPTIKNHEVQEQDIKTTHFSVNPRFRSTAFNRFKFEGYTVSTGLEVKMRDFLKILDIMDDVIQAGATRISTVIFTLEEPKKHEAEVREKAMKAAEAKARQIAGLSGVTLGKPIVISEFPPPETSYYDPYSRIHVQAGKTSALLSPTDITLATPEIPVAFEPGQIKLTYTIYITYELQ